MAFRTRDLYYMVRVGNYASRPLRALSGDFRALSTASDQATTQLARLEQQQRKLASRRATLVNRVMSPQRELQTQAATQSLLARRVRYEGQIRDLELSRSKINTALYRNQTQQLDLTFKQQQAQARVNMLTEKGIEDQRLATAQHRATIIGRQLTGVRMAGGDIAAGADTLRRSQINLQNQIKLTNTQLKIQQEHVVANEAEVRRLIGELRVLGEQELIVAEQIAQVNAELVKQRWDRIAMGGRALTDLGRSAQYAGGIILATLGYMAHGAANFSTQVTLAATQVGNTVRQTQVATGRIQASILRQMRQFPASSEEMAKASYDIFSSLKLQGNQAQQTAKGMHILNTFNKAAVAGQTNLVDVTHAGITALNDFGKANKNGAVNVGQLTGFMNRAFAAVRFGRMTFQEFTQALSTTAPAAKAANQTFSNMSGTLAFLTTRIPSVRTAGIAYARLLEVLQRSKGALLAHDVRITDLAGRMKPLNQIIGDLVTHFPKLAQGRRFITEFFKEITKGTGTSGTQGTIQARRALVFLVQQYRQYQKILHETTGDQTEFTKSFTALSQSSGVKFQVFMNNLKATALTIGADVTPALLKMIKPIQDALMWFDRLSNSTKNSIANFAAWTGGVLLIGGTLSALIGLLIRSAEGFKKVGLAMRDAAIYMGVMEGEIAVIQPELLIGMGVIAATALIIKFHTQLGHVLSRLGITKRALLNFWPVRVTVDIAHFIAMLGRLGAALINAARHFGSTSRSIASHIPVLQHVWKWIGKIIGYWHTLASFKPISLVVHFISDLTHWKPPGVFGKILGGAEKYGGKAFSLFHDPVATAIEAATKAGDAATKAINKYADPINAKLAATRGEGPHHRGGFWTRQRQQTQDTVKAATAQLQHNRTVQQWIALADKVIRIARAHPKNLADQIRMERVLDQINKKFTGDQLKGINDVINADTAASKKRVSNAEKAARKAAAAAKRAARAFNTTANEAASNLRQIYDTFSQQNQQAFGDVTSGVRTQNAMQFGVSPTPSDLLKDMRDMVHKFRRWRNELGQLAGKVPYAMIQQLEQAGPDSELVVRGLLNLTPKQLAEYKGMFTQGQKSIEQATRQDFNMQLADWRKRGKRAALAFMRGVGDEKQYINKQMRAIFTAWAKGNLSAQLGTQGGTATQHARRARAGHGHTQVPRHSRTTPHTPAHHYHDTIVIQQNKNEDTSTTLRKARLAQKTRRARFA